MNEKNGGVITIANATQKTLCCYVVTLKRCCYNGMDHACDGKSLIRGMPDKPVCPYYRNEKCTNIPIMNEKRNVLAWAARAQARERRKTDGVLLQEKDETASV